VVPLRFNKNNQDRRRRCGGLVKPQIHACAITVTFALQIADKRIEQ
jgi:hypothetical protein